MATPAAVLSIVVEANTSPATRSLAKFRGVLKAAEKKVTATLGLDDREAKRKLGEMSKEMARFALRTAEGKLKLDKTEFEAQLTSARGALDSVERDKITPEMGLKLAGLYADVAKAEAVLKAVPDEEVNIDIDRSMLSRLSSISRGAKDLSSSFNALGVAAGGAGGEAGGFAAKLGGLAGPLGSMAPLFAAAAVAATALAAALAALAASASAALIGLGALATGAAAAMTVGFGGIAAIAGPAISSLTDLISAQEAANKAQSTGGAAAAATAKANAQAVTAAHQQVADAVRGVTAAEAQLATAQRSVQVAQESLTLARFEATRQLQDMRLAAMQSETSEKRARLSVAQAEANLREVMSSSTASRLEIRDAELSVTEARENLKNVTIAGNRAQQDFNRAQKGGLSQMPGVLSAQRSLDDALRGVKTAQLGVADAHRSVRRAMANLAEAQRKANEATGAGATQMAALQLAMKKAGPEAVAFSHHLKDVGQRWRRLTQAGQANFFGMLEDGLDRLDRKMPLLADSANKSMRAMRRAFGGFLKIATGPEFDKFIKVMTRTFAKSIGPFSRAFGNIAKVLQRIAIAVAPFVIKMARGFERLTKTWVDGTKNGKELRKTIGGLLDHLSAWLDLIGTLGKVFVDFFKVLAPSGKGMVEWMTKGAQALDDWINSKEGREQIKAFMKDMLPLVKELAHALYNGLRAWLLISRALAIILTPALKIVNWLLDKILGGNKKGLKDMIHLGDAFKWVGTAARNTIKWLKGAWEWIKNLGKGTDVLKGKWDDLGRILTWPFRALWSIAKKVWDWIGDKWGKLGDLLKAPFRGIAGFVKDAFGAVKNTIQDIWRWIKDKLDKIKDAIETIRGGPDLKITGKPSTPEERRARQFFQEQFGGQRGGLVTAQGIIPQGFQGGGIVGPKGLPPGGRDTVPALLEVGELVIPKKMVDQTRKNAKLTAKTMTGELGKGHKEARKDTERFVKDHGKLWMKLRDVTKKTTDRFRKGTTDDFQKTSKSARDQTDQMRQRVGEGFKKTQEQTMDSSQKMKQGVSQDYRELGGAVREGLGKIAKMTNNALKALGVKKVEFNIATEKKQRGGHIGGAGVGDKVPALLEPGEFVVNKKAAKTARPALERLNQDVPRFARGGSVGGGMAAMIREANKFEQRHFPYAWGGGHGGFGIQPVDCSGAVSDILHAGGLLSSPLTSGALMNWGKAGKGAVTVYTNPHHVVMSLNGKVFGTSGSNPGGGAGWIEGGRGEDLAPGAIRTMDVAGAMAKEVKRVLVKGQKGPLRDTAQAALDKVRGAANKYIAKKTPMGFGGGQSSIYKGKLDRIFPTPGPAIKAWQAAMLAERVGLPGITYAQIAKGESGLRPGAVSPDGGYGLWQMTPRVQSAATVRAWERIGSYFNPWNNAQMAKVLAGGGTGVSNYFGTGFVTGGIRHWHGEKNFQKGGMVAAPFVGSFADGGTVGQTGLGLLHKGEQVTGRDTKGSDLMALLPPLRQVARNTRNLWIEIKRRETIRNRNFISLGTDPEGEALPMLEGVDAMADHVKALGKVIKTFQRNITSGLSQESRKRLRKLERIDASDRTKKQRKELAHLKELTKAHPELKKAEKRERVHLTNQDKLSKAERQRLRDLDRQHRFHRREERRQRRIQRQVGDLQERQRNERVLVEQISELNKQIKEQNRNYKTIKASERVAVAALANIVNAQIGAKGQEKRRLAAAGSVVRY